MKLNASWLAKVALTLCTCAALACISPAFAESDPAEQYYNAGSLPLFEIAFSRMDVSDQEAWLEKLYADDSASFFSAAVRKIDADSSLPAGLAEQAYADGKTAMFSILMDRMGQAELESWLDRALEDENGVSNPFCLISWREAMNSTRWRLSGKRHGLRCRLRRIRLWA